MLLTRPLRIPAPLPGDALACRIPRPTPSRRPCPRPVHDPGRLRGRWRVHPPRRRPAPPAPPIRRSRQPLTRGGLPDDRHRRRRHRVEIAAEPRDHRVADAGERPRSCSRSAPATGSSRADDGSDYPPEAAALPDVATFSTRRRREGRRPSSPTSWSPAASASRRPMPSPACATSVSRCSSSTPRRSDGVFEDIELIGTATGTADAATALVTGMRAEHRRRQRGRRRPGAASRACFYEVGYDATTGAIFGAGRRLVPRRDGDARRWRHRSRPATPATYEISLEELIEEDPEMILLGTTRSTRRHRRAGRGSPRLGRHDRRQDGDVRPSTTSRSPGRGRGCLASQLSPRRSIRTRRCRRRRQPCVARRRAAPERHDRVERSVAALGPARPRRVRSRVAARRCSSSLLVLGVAARHRRASRRSTPSAIILSRRSGSTSGRPGRRPPRPSSGSCACRAS